MPWRQCLSRSPQGRLHQAPLKTPLLTLPLAQATGSSARKPQEHDPAAAAAAVGTAGSGCSKGLVEEVFAGGCRGLKGRAMVSQTLCHTAWGVDPGAEEGQGELLSDAPASAPTVPFSPGPSHSSQTSQAHGNPVSSGTLGLPAFFQLAVRGTPPRLMLPSNPDCRGAQAKARGTGFRVKAKEPQPPLSPTLRPRCCCS